LRLLEYVNHPGGTTLSDARAANGSPEPYGVKMWCLGNEMDGPWQLGHMTAEEYASIACRAAGAMRQLQPDLELVVCGSSGSQMPTFGEWERTVLERCYDVVDFVSCHAYYQIEDGDLGTFLAAPVNLERYVDTTVAVADYIKGRKGTDKTINISLDEWNVWYQAEQAGQEPDAEAWPAAPARIEDDYTLADAVVVGSLLITILKRAARIHSASLAQLVNAIAPIRTEAGGPAWRQSTFHPFAITSRLAQGEVLPTRVDCGAYPNPTYGEVPLVDAVATHDQVARQGALFLVNRDLGQAAEAAVDVSWLGAPAVLEAFTLAGDDPFAVNSAAQPDRVRPAANTTVRLENSRTLRLTLPPMSWTAVALGTH
jgi:alpha-N-arabinofuranosidase